MNPPLLNDKYAPTTSAIGFIRSSLSDAAVALTAWRRELGLNPRVRSVLSLQDGLRDLEPLVGGATPRELLVAAGPTWTAYFDCLMHGTDPIGPMSYLAKSLRTVSVAVHTVPHTFDGSRGRMGAAQFEMFGPEDREFLNSIRSVAATFDGDRWVFVETGTPQWFEEGRRYRARSVRDRLTFEMLHRYCDALGIPAFDASQYGDALLIESIVPMPPGILQVSRKDVQAAMGISAASSASR
jgi:hypothetical protein